MSNIVCLDMEGVLVPEIWVAFSEKTGLPELKKTTRDEPDYDKLMQFRIKVLKEKGIRVSTDPLFVPVKTPEQVQTLSALSAEIQRDKKGNILYDKETKDIEIVKYEESIDDYMAREVLPHIPDAVAFFEENLTAKKPVIKVGAEIPFTRYFYKYQQPVPSEELEQKFLNLEKSVSERIKKLFGEEKI